MPCLTKKNITTTELDTEASLTMEGLSITNIHLSITGKVPTINAEEFTSITNDVERNC